MNPTPQSERRKIEDKHALEVNAAPLCIEHCGHPLDWMKFDEDFEQVRCAYPVGHACDYCGGLNVWTRLRFG